MWPREHETQNVAMRVHAGLEGSAMRGCPGSGAMGTQLTHLPASPCDIASFVSMRKSERGVYEEICANLACSHSIHESQKVKSRQVSTNRPVGIHRAVQHGTSLILEKETFS